MGSDKHAICGCSQAKGVNLDVINSSTGQLYFGAFQPFIVNE